MSRRCHKCNGGMRLSKDGLSLRCRGCGHYLCDECDAALQRRQDEQEWLRNSPEKRDALRLLAAAQYVAGGLKP